MWMDLERLSVLSRPLLQRQIPPQMGLMRSSLLYFGQSLQFAISTLSKNPTQTDQEEEGEEKGEEKGEPIASVELFALNSWRPLSLPLTKRRR